MVNIELIKSIIKKQDCISKEIPEIYKLLHKLESSNLAFSKEEQEYFKMIIQKIETINSINQSFDYILDNLIKK